MVWREIKMRYTFSGTVKGTDVASVYAAVRTNENLRQTDAFKALFKKTGFPGTELNENCAFGYNWSLDLGGPVPQLGPGRIGIIDGVDHKYNFRREFPTEKGYVISGGMYAGKSVPGIIMLVAHGIECGPEEVNSAINDFIAKSGLEETEFPEEIISRVKKDPILETRLEELRGYQKVN